MTYSIVARDAKTGEFGIAVASRFFAVGAIVPHMAGGIGAIATQAFISPLYGTDGLQMLKAGKSAEEVLEAVIGRDEGRHARQLHLIDAQGRSAAFTGEKCIDWAGHLIEENVSVAGNMLAGPGVIAETMESYLKNADLPLVERLLTAMEAGEKAGGDKRGKQSAALRIVRTEAFPWLDIRTDDHADPLAELRRLHDVARERFLHVAETLPTTENVSGMLDRSVIDRRIAELEAERLASGRPSASFATPPVPAP
ncbi:DUF1028 domain-containing protein [Roseibium aggregatum]|uniref:DUF1028 domain-containing protein n=1 Tax=Roseibium aggregatum TaxID=187304 RepID=A0A926NZI5_9HYPH|nr:DUF1028 domain-containing protein [Roseibium aggregatum]MBD1548309.1 DUF1028 domain-containing protein [Roseibium aggregatum]